ncbi:hypothetical protein WR25_19397 [Diploscapter pachys]|uniref:Ras-GEF domain-containing protein n=1 Tax=Diploscapter pachys TaxID=2018661 RepID=A0A2A2K981_9BILA|nr:hypothetical protein WR25_19397 [Diploscapter pachys]
MPHANEVDVALTYLIQITAKRLPPHHILLSTQSLLDAISSRSDATVPELQNNLIRLLKSVDEKSLKDQFNEADYNEITTVAKQLENYIKYSLPSAAAANRASTSSIKSEPRSSRTSSTTTNNGTSKTSSTRSRASNSESTESSTNGQTTKEEEENLDNVLRQLNLRQVPKFQPVFEFANSESDDDGITTDERKEERAEKHGQKLCEEEVETLPDGTTRRIMKTKTISTTQTVRHVTRSTKGGGCPEITRKFVDGDRTLNEDEELKTDDFFKKSPLFERFNLHSKFPALTCSEEPIKQNGHDEKEKETGQSQKTKSVERTSEVTQSVSQKKERNGKLLGEMAATKLDSSELKAKQIDSYLGKLLLDRKGEGSYEENTVIKQGKPEIEPVPASPPRKHVVEYIQHFGNKENTAVDYLRGTTIASYISLNDNLRFQEEQFRKKLQFEFSTTGTSSVFPDFYNLSSLLDTDEFVKLTLPTKWAEEIPDAKPIKEIDWLKKEAIGEEEDLICSFDVNDYLLMRADTDQSKPLQIRGGPKDALIVYGTQPVASLVFQEAFLVTYRTFVSSLDLINKLIKRYLYMVLSDDSVSSSAAKNTFSVIVRVVDELTTFELQSPLINSVTSFVYRLIRDGNFTFARILRKRLLERIEDPRPSPLSCIPKIIPNKKQNLFDFSSSAIACQMTYLDAELFHAIEPPELLWWAQDQDEKKSPNLVKFTEHFNHISFWVRTLVLTPGSQSERERYLNKFLKIMKHLRKHNNFNSYLAIMSALLSSPVERLDWNRRLWEQLTEHGSVMNTEKSHKNYRDMLQSAKPPVVPFIGVVLQDLIFIHAGNPDKIPPERCCGRTTLINFLKRWHQYAVLDSIRKLKKWNYDIQKDDPVFYFLHNSTKNFMNDDQTWSRSYEIKATQRRS